MSSTSIVNMADGLMQYTDILNFGLQIWKTYV
jgi:hypothetical protein